MNMEFNEDFSEEDFDGPEIIVDSIYPIDQERLIGFNRVAKTISYGAPTEKGFLKQLNEFGIKDVVSSEQVIEVSEIAKRLSTAVMNEVHNKPWERFTDERHLAYSTTLRTMRSIYGADKQALAVKSWIPGARIKHENGDVFELTGRKCKRCHVNPEAYGHGGGIRCFDVDNCGYWFCY